jgi:hypothetical protein
MLCWWRVSVFCASNAYAGVYWAASEGSTLAAAAMTGRHGGDTPEMRESGKGESPENELIR